MGAMEEEIHQLIPLLVDHETRVLGKRTYHLGKILNTDVVVVFSRWGKVAAATTATTLIHEFGISNLIFTGVAGALDPTLQIGDIVIGNRFYQHDMNAMPLFEKFEIPLLGKAIIESNPNEVAHVSELINTMFQEHLKKDSLIFLSKPVIPNIRIGAIASGDQFFSSKAQKNELLSILPKLLCVEMEGAAVAQVCDEYQIPFIIIRTISDTADDDSVSDFQSFIKQVAGKYSRMIVIALLKANSIKTN